MKNRTANIIIGAAFLAGLVLLAAGYFNSFAYSLVYFICLMAWLTSGGIMEKINSRLFK